ncbi:hypothetical protein [uncultured Anaerococcus sp.]|uniref:hypothetical protein n=1 Tax=uncultured Anaerococcus sp. TaxID=293428 RepID=UPI002600D7D2|nr:hypothetical protein [uncultured Anaerococcus sp.]
MEELYFVTIYCEVKDYYELMATNEEKAKEKAWNIALNKLPNAEHPTIFVESNSERREREEYEEFLEWKKNKEKESK